MFGSVVVEVGLGLVLTFCFFSIIMTSAREGLEAILKTKAKLLEKTIFELLGQGSDSAVVKAFYDHPAINALFPGGYQSQSRKLPSYIPSANFAAALTDLKDVKDSLPAEVQAMIDNAIAPAVGGLKSLQLNLENWYNSAMDRVAGTYKRQTQLWLFGLGFVFAAAGNINPITIGDRLASDQQLRADIVALAPIVVTQKQDATDAAAVMGKQLHKAGLPIGWQYVCKPPSAQNGTSPPDCHYSTGEDVLTTIGGWIIAALAGMLGAPFWFDILNKIVNIRSSVKPDTPAATAK